MFRRLFRLPLIAAVLFLAALPARAGQVTVFAAASLTDALNEIGADYKQDTGNAVVFSFAASSALARQIEASSGADVFISADTDWMDYLDKKSLIAPGTRFDLLGNTLVLIAPASSPVKLTIKPHFDLLGALAGGKLALADPNSVPAGKYAKAALITLGVWDSVAASVVPAENVRVALAYVAQGEAPLGAVYATDAKIEPKVRVVDAFPAGTYPPVVYPAALVKGGDPQARAFLEYLRGAKASAVFLKDGFAVLDR
jgi:molybdate transport system substrate-binding protein